MEIDDKTLAPEKMRDFIDRQLTFLLGLDNMIDKEIMRYLYREKVASYAQLLIYMVYEHEYCDDRRLRARLKSLVDFKYLNKFDFYNNTFYQIVIDKLTKESL